MDDHELGTLLDSALATQRYERDDLYLFPTKLAWRMTNEVHVRDPAWNDLVAAIKAHPDIASVLGKCLNTGGGGAQLTDAGLGIWLLTEASKTSGAGAVALLREFLGSPHCSSTEYLAFSGLEVASRLQLTEDIDIVPIADLPESELTISLADPEWEYFGRTKSGQVRRKTCTVLSSFGTKTVHSNPLVATAALRRRRRLVPNLVDESAMSLGLESELAELIAPLAVITSAAIFPIAYWAAADTKVPLSDSAGWAEWDHLKALRQFATSRGRESEIIAFLQRYRSCPSDFRAKLKTPMDRFNRSLAAIGAIDIAIELGVALEALLLTDLQPNDQISLAFRLRGAWLLGRDAIERRDLSKQFLDIYGCRSSAVHKGTMPTDPITTPTGKLGPDEFIRTIGQSLAARCLVAIIERGRFPDWNAVLLGG